MKVFTMVKGEVDIVDDWILYHGTIFGFKNLYIIDNYSRDGTWEALLKQKDKYNINLFRMPDYKKKGNYMTALLRTVGKNEIVFPIDIDEFIVFYDKENNKISCDKNTIIQYIKSLKPLPYYKMNYISVKNINPNGSKRATTEMSLGKYEDYGGHAKTFFYCPLFKGVIDHGNHYHSDNYKLSKLCLVHFHQRNLTQLQKKIFNNITGLGYNPFDIRSLKYLQTNRSIQGYHHIDKQIAILEKRFALDIENPEDSDISLKPLNEIILELSI